MNKEDLAKLGLDGEMVKKVIDLYKSSLDNNFIAKHRFDEVNNEVKGLKEKVAERDEQIKSLEKYGKDHKELQEKLEKLMEQNTEKDKNYKETLTMERKKNAVKIALLADEAGSPHDVEMVMGLFDISRIDIDESGKLISGYKEQNENIRKEKTFLFNAPLSPKTDEPKVGLKFMGTTPANSNNDGDGVDKATIYGKNLAQMKLKMMGVKPKENK